MHSRIGDLANLREDRFDRGDRSGGLEADRQLLELKHDREILRQRMKAAVAELASAEGAS